MTEENIYTEFNSNKATLMRVDSALKRASYCCSLDDYSGWFKALGDLRREAVVKMSEEQEKECNIKFLNLEREFAILGLSKANTSFHNTKIDNKLDSFEIFLRKIMDTKGMLLRDKEQESGL